MGDGAAGIRGEHRYIASPEFIRKKDEFDCQGKELLTLSGAFTLQ
jgi:hypothetical protein